MTVAIVALSGRALAAAARRAGERCCVVDCFADEDTRALAQRCIRVDGALAHGFTAALLRGALPGLDISGIVYGAGFEADPALLAILAETAPVLGNPPEIVAAVKDPTRLAATLAALGLPHPQTRLAPPEHGEGWLSKRVGGSGGVHIRRAGAVAPGRYYQREVAGRPVSVLFVADGRRARTIGFSAQWCDATPEQPFRYGGCVTPAGLGMRLEEVLAEACDAIVRATGLVGLNSLDLLVAGEGFHVIEINPRPGATLDIFDGSGALKLWPLHLAGIRGGLPAVPRAPAGGRAASLVYAPRPLTVPPGFAWPDWAADRSSAGSVMASGDPVCTVLASAATAEDAEQTVRERAHRILAALGAI